MINIKRIYDPREPDDGFRVLCTSTWPRGIRKEAVDAWKPELGTPAPLKKRWLAGELSTEDFDREMAPVLQTPEAQAALQALADIIRTGQSLTLLTSVKDMSMTHLHLVKAAIEAQP